jgi:hypothetical protein
MNRHRALGLCLSTIFSENRFTLFRIMFQDRPGSHERHCRNGLEAGRPGVAQVEWMAAELGKVWLLALPRIN